MENVWFTVGCECNEQRYVGVPSQLVPHLHLASVGEIYKSIEDIASEIDCDPEDVTDERAAQLCIAAVPMGVVRLIELINLQPEVKCKTRLYLADFRDSPESAQNTHDDPDPDHPFWKDLWVSEEFFAPLGGREEVARLLRLLS